MNKKFPFLASFVCFVAVLVLCALGAWQVERLQWKNNLQQNLDAAFADENPAAFTADQFQTIQKSQVIRGRAEGQLDVSKAVLLNGRIQDGKSVKAVIAPLSIPLLGVTVPVEIGCGISPKADHLQSLQNQKISVTGILRQPRWSFATPVNNPSKGEWWRVDAQELGAYWSVQGMSNAVITAENTADLVPELNACPIEKKLRNDHASYVFFWFVMAGVLSIIWGIRFLKPYLQSA